MPNLLFEIGTEEIPANCIEPALQQMEALLQDLLKKNRLVPSEANVMGFKKIITTGTPRRLVIFAEDIPERQESIVQETIGPSAKIAFDPSGQPTKAAIGFAKSQGLDVKTLKIKETPRGDYCVAIKTLEGQETSKLLPEILISIIKSITFPKTMKWKKGGIYFSRPIRTLLALFGSEILDVKLNGVKAGRITSGHPFLSGRTIKIESADYEQYKRKLKEEKVIVDVAERRTILRGKVNELLSAYGSQLDDESRSKLQRDEELLEEVTNLVEYPYAIEGSYEESYLSIPAEVIVAAIKEHQRYFPVTDRRGSLLPKFIVVSNRNERSADKVREGNQNVLKARLADANFFWEEDKRIPLWSRIDGLKNVIFQEKLGSYYDRTLRIVRLSRFIASNLNLSPEKIEMVEKASHLCKADLLTAMVGEFPSLQGIIGREYAKQQGEPEEVAVAIAEHYLPRYSGDKLPTTKTGMVVSLADKFDTVVGCFSVGLIPSGSQDPYALRRQLSGIIRIIEAHSLRLSLKETIEKCLSLLSPTLIPSPYVKAHILAQVIDFFKDRLYQTHLEQGYRYDIINAVMASGFDDVADLQERLKVISHLSTESLWHGLVKLVERTFNIGKNADAEGDVDEKLLTEVQEQELWKTYLKHKDEILTLIQAKEYEKASRQYHNVFAHPVHVFFDKVFVNVEDKRIRNNRIMLSKKINELFSKGIADLSKIVTEG